MRTDEQCNDLQKRYASLSDNELITLYQQREDLTAVAQDALRGEFQFRKLQPPSAESQSANSNEPLDDSMVPLWEFVDAMNANEAMTLLEKNELDARLVPERIVERSDATRVMLWRLHIARSDQERAIALLRKHRGLFPLPEQVALDANDSPDESDLFVVAEFDNSEDAALAAHGLTASGVPFRSTQEQHEAHIVWIFEVAQNDVDRAGNAMERAFAAASPAAAES